MFKREKEYTQKDLSDAMDKFFDAEDDLQLFNYEFVINKHKYRVAVREYKMRIRTYQKIKKWLKDKEKSCS